MYTTCRAFGKELFMDSDRLGVEAEFGSFTEPDAVQSGPLSPMKGRCAFAWAGAVLHVLTAEDVKTFITHVHAMLAPDGVFFGVSPAICFDACADVDGCSKIACWCKRLPGNPRDSARSAKP